jgi:hypothetical protein
MRSKISMQSKFTETHISMDDESGTNALNQIQKAVIG